RIALCIGDFKWGAVNIAVVPVIMKTTGLFHDNGEWGIIAVLFVVIGFQAYLDTVYLLPDFYA
ncbi:TPA: hypothetical protein ACWMH4_003638, partial [Proteus mirabilis]